MEIRDAFFFYTQTFFVFLLSFKLHTSNATKRLHTHPQSRDQAQLRPPSPEMPPTTETAATTTTRTPTAPVPRCLKTAWSRSSGWTCGGPSGGATGPVPCSLYPTRPRPASVPPAPRLDLPPPPITGAIPSTGATLSSRHSGSTWTR